MPKVQFSDLAIRNLRPPEQGQTDFWDTKLASFGCRVSQGGSKTFIVKSRNRRIRLGRYPDLSLQDARRAAHKLISEAREPETAPRAPTLPEALATYYATHCASLRPGTVKEITRMLKKLPALDLSTQEIYKLIDAIEAPSEQLHTFTAWKGFYIWAARRQYLTRSPMEGMKPPAQNPPRERLLTDEEIRQIWNCGNQVVRLLICTGQRFNQIASLQWDWIENDSIQFPASVMKNKLAHSLPIGPLTIAQLPPERGYLLFPSGDDPTQPMPNKGRDRYVKRCSVKNWVMHDCRRFYASTMASLGVPIATCELLLSHVSGSMAGIVRVYQRYNFEKEKRDAQLKYEQYLTDILGV